VALTHRGSFILIFAIDHQLGSLLTRAFGSAPLRPDEFALTSVLRLTGPLRPGDLAATVGMRPSSLSNYLRRLGEAGIVRRRRDPTDGRAALISLTAKGVRATEACFPAFSAATQAFRRHLATEGVDEEDLITLLEGASAALDGAIGEFADIEAASASGER
jgi:DNA-binding MarR family transcriptional regulator